MKIAAHYLGVGAVVAAAGIVAQPAITVLAAIAGVFVVHRAWVTGHEDGWHDGCIETSRLRDLLIAAASRDEAEQ